MKKAIATIFTLISFFLEMNAQVVDSLNQQVCPKGGVNQLAIKYYGINFTKEQRKEIGNVEIEIIYSIDEFGNPTLSEINGISNPHIIDSLKNKTSEIGLFNPQIVDGIPVPSIYFIKLTFPTYSFTQQIPNLFQGNTYREAKLEDFEYINESGQRLDMTAGGLMNQFIGNPSKHLALGGGMKIDIAYSGKNKLIYGINMNFYSNKLKEKYPLNTTRQQFDAPPTLLVGLIFGKWFDKFNIQGELGPIIQNVTENLGEYDKDWVQLKGWTSGVVINYPIKLGKSKPQYYYGPPTLLEHNLNLHFGLRYIKLSLKEATGAMVELGLSYRITSKKVKEYKLK